MRERSRRSPLAEVGRAQRYHHELSLAYIDVDDFEAVETDRLGHSEGDRVLLGVSHMMRSSVRATDTVARIGGDEFAILMPEIGASSARVVIDRVRGELGRLRTVEGGPVPCSIGLVTFDRPPASLSELVGAGDESLPRQGQPARTGSSRPSAQAPTSSSAADPTARHGAQLREVTR